MKSIPSPSDLTAPVASKVNEQFLRIPLYGSIRSRERVPNHEQIDQVNLKHQKEDHFQPISGIAIHNLLTISKDPHQIGKEEEGREKRQDRHLT